ncbi:hypothetical protein FRX31_005824, partial [Thalictrum thalictroides]
MERGILRDDLNYLLRCDRIKWKQKSKTRFYQECQTNTKYFHAMANMRRRSNSLASFDIDGTVTRDGR